MHFKKKLKFFKTKLFILLLPFKLLLTLEKCSELI